MLEHIHLLVSEPSRDTLADALKSLKQGVARRLIGDADHFWQKRYYDFNVRNEAQFVEKLHYIHSNPVNAGLCGRPEDWPWSSFLHHATGCEGRVEIESEWTARKRERAAGNLCPAVELPHSSHPARGGGTPEAAQHRFRHQQAPRKQRRWTVKGTSLLAGGPFKPDFGLSGAVLKLDGSRKIRG